MQHRFLVRLGALTVAAAVMSLAQVPAAGQAPTSVGKTEVSRTADGHPNLQGTWTYATLVTLERPDELAGKQVLNDEEAAQVAGQPGRFDQPAKAGDPGVYNEFWMDRGLGKKPRDKRTSLLVDPPNGRLPALTPAAEKRLAAMNEALPGLAGPEVRPLKERCIMGFNAGPPMIPATYNNFVQIFQTRGYVTIYNEMVHNARIVPMNGRPHGTIRQWNGDSRGHWEGDTLVVDTINFTSKGTGGYREPSLIDEQAHLVERFRRVDADTLLYEFTVDDPTTWVKPWTAMVPMTESPEHIYEYACHEGNYAMFDMLAGARTEEKKAAQEAAKKGSK